MTSETDFKVSALHRSRIDEFDVSFKRVLEIAQALLVEQVGQFQTRVHELLANIACEIGGGRLTADKEFCDCNVIDAALEDLKVIEDERAVEAIKLIKELRSIWAKRSETMRAIQNGDFFNATGETEYYFDAEVFYRALKSVQKGNSVSFARMVEGANLTGIRFDVQMIMSALSKLRDGDHSQIVNRFLGQVGNLKTMELDDVFFRSLGRKVKILDPRITDTIINNSSISNINWNYSLVGKLLKMFPDNNPALLKIFRAKVPQVVSFGRALSMDIRRIDPANEAGILS